jgi:hypothetical protein
MSLSKSICRKGIPTATISSNIEEVAKSFQKSTNTHHPPVLSREPYSSETPEEYLPSSQEIVETLKRARQRLSTGSEPLTKLTDKPVSMGEAQRILYRQRQSQNAPQPVRSNNNNNSTATTTTTTTHAAPEEAPPQQPTENKQQPPSPPVDEKEQQRRAVIEQRKRDRPEITQEQYEGLLKGRLGYASEVIQALNKNRFTTSFVGQFSVGVMIGKHDEFEEKRMIVVTLMVDGQGKTRFHLEGVETMRYDPDVSVLQHHLAKMYPEFAPRGKKLVHAPEFRNSADSTVFISSFSTVLDQELNGFGVHEYDERKYVPLYHSLICSEDLELVRSIFKRLCDSTSSRNDENKTTSKIQ